MQGVAMRDYINERPRSRKRCSGNTNHKERRLCQLTFLSFGVLCIIQATLNISLRLAFDSNKESTCSDCNMTCVGDKNPVVPEVPVDCKENRPCHCNELQERFNALTAERNLLENRISELNNTIKALLKKQREVSGCVSSQRCPPGWREINSRCYFLSTDIKTWEDSRVYCQGKKADLVVINSEQEQRAIYRLDGDADLLFWIGLHGTSGTFRWVDGSELTKSFWLPGQPDHGGLNNIEDCVEMYHHHLVLSSWNDAPCGHRLRWLCEKDPCDSL